MPVNSREKGKRAEREAARSLVAVLGIEAKRGVQYQGGTDSPDLKTSLEGVHFEVKHVEKLNLMEAFEQAKRDAKSKIPVVMHKKNRTGWFLTIRLEDVKSFIANVEESNGQC